MCKEHCHKNLVQLLYKNDENEKKKIVNSIYLWMLKAVSNLPKCLWIII